MGNVNDVVSCLAGGEVCASGLNEQAWGVGYASCRRDRENKKTEMENTITEKQHPRGNTPDTLHQPWSGMDYKH